MTDFSEIYLTEDADNFPLTAEILRKFPNAEKKYVSSPKELYFKPRNNPDKITAGKKQLFLTARKEDFIERCPGTKKHLCCNYFVTKNLLGCPADCSYCYLQAYMNIRAITVFVNKTDFLGNFEQHMNSSAVRIGTGEFADSLFLDDFLNINKSLIEICSRANSLLELKTKSDNVESILKLDHKGRTVMAWSLSPSPIIKTEEKGTASLKKRIEAAKKCASAGYPLAFHFDPLIHFSGWENAYKELIEELFSKISPENIAWISLGALRFHPRIKHIIYSRFPDSKILTGEFIRGEDGKYRYLKYIRIEMFTRILSFLRKFDKNMSIYLCMESEEIWRSVFRSTPPEISNLKHIFGHCVK